MIKVLVNGFLGRMGTQVVSAVSSQDDMEVVAGVDFSLKNEYVSLLGKDIAPAFDDLELALDKTIPDVMIDFTAPASVENNLRIALSRGVDCVVGTTGLSAKTYSQLIELAPKGTTLFHAPNFTLGAVMMMQFAKMAGKYFADAEVIEFHHNGKKDAPSGTAINTALDIAKSRRLAGIETKAPGKETELPAYLGARGGDVEGVPVHSIRSNGYVAHQEVIFGSPGETLTIRHDSIDRASYMPGVLLAVRKVGSESGLIIGLDKLMDL